MLLGDNFLGVDLTSQRDTCWFYLTKVLSYDTELKDKWCCDVGFLHHDDQKWRTTDFPHYYPLPFTPFKLDMGHPHHSVFRYMKHYTLPSDPNVYAYVFWIVVPSYYYLTSEINVNYHFESAYCIYQSFTVHFADYPSHNYMLYYPANYNLQGFIEIPKKVQNIMNMTRVHGMGTSWNVTTSEVNFLTSLISQLSEYTRPYNSCAVMPGDFRTLGTAYNAFAICTINPTARDTFYHLPSIGWPYHPQQATSDYYYFTITKSGWTYDV